MIGNACTSDRGRCATCMYATACSVAPWRCALSQDGAVAQCLVALQVGRVAQLVLAEDRAVHLRAQQAGGPVCGGQEGKRRMRGLCMRVRVRGRELRWGHARRGECER